MTDPTPILGTNLASAIVPFTDADQFPTHYAQYGKGGWRSVDTMADRDAIPDLRLENGMVVYVVENQTPFIYINSSWQELVTGGGSGGMQTFVRMNYSKTVETLPPETSTEFELPLGQTTMILKLTVTRPVKVTVYSTPDHSDTNPYTFLATTDHLTDDGSMLLSDGSVLKQRNYSIFANLEVPPQEKVYAVMESVDSSDGPVTLDILYIVIEADVTPTPPSGGGGTMNYIVPMAFTYPPSPNEVLQYHTVVETVTFAIDFQGSAGHVEAPPASPYVIRVYKNGSEVGSITVGTDGSFVFTCPEALSFSPGNTIKFVAPTIPDTNIGNLSVSLLGTRVSV